MWKKNGTTFQPGWCVLPFFFRIKSQQGSFLRCVNISSLFSKYTVYPPQTNRLHHWAWSTFKMSKFQLDRTTLRIDTLAFIHVIIPTFSCLLYYHFTHLLLYCEYDRGKRICLTHWHVQLPSPMRYSSSALRSVCFIAIFWHNYLFG